MGGVIPNDIVPNHVVIPRAANAALNFAFLREQLAKTQPVSAPADAGIDRNITAEAQRQAARMPTAIGTQIDLLG